MLELLKKPIWYTLESGPFREFGGSFIGGEALVLAIHVTNYSKEIIYIDKIQGIMLKTDDEPFNYKKSLLKFDDKDLKLEPNQKKTFIIPEHKIKEADIIFVTTIGKKLKIPYKKIQQEMSKNKAN